MKIAYTAWTWVRYIGTEAHPVIFLPEETIETSIRELKECGYDCYENFRFVEDIYGQKPDELKAVFEKYGMNFSCLYNYLGDGVEEDYEICKRNVEFMKKLGVKHMNLEAPSVPLDEWRAKVDPDHVVPLEKTQETVEQVNVLGKLCYENGISLNLHPHYGTYVETEEQIDYFLAHTDPKYVHLCLDTAHTYICGMDPIKLFDKLLATGRVAYIHFKDVDPHVEDYPGPIQSFMALGQGVLDFRGITKVLKKYDYDDIICVELDHQRLNNYESAEYSRNYIRKVLGM